MGNAEPFSQRLPSALGHRIRLPMPRPPLEERLPEVTASLVDSIHALPTLRRLGHGYLPNRHSAVEAVDRLMQLIFPGYFGRQGLTPNSLPYHVGELVGELFDLLFEPIHYCLRFRADRPDCPQTDIACDREAERIVLAFFNRLPRVREMAVDDVAAHFEGDPAAGSHEETIFSYPGLYAITVQRLAHELYEMDVPLLPRTITEHAHAQTGIDIHPGAELGGRLLIDHGTGVVIGETCRVGVNVKIYQGVTLGALAPGHGQKLRGMRRHPTIEDDVTIYAGATILGGDTVIGRGSTIGGNVFLTQSVPPNTRVVAEPPSLRYREKGGARTTEHLAPDFQI